MAKVTNEVQYGSGRQPASPLTNVRSNAEICGHVNRDGKIALEGRPQFWDGPDDQEGEQ